MDKIAITFWRWMRFGFRLRFVWECVNELRVIVISQFVVGLDASRLQHANGASSLFCLLPHLSFWLFLSLSYCVWDDEVERAMFSPSAWCFRPSYHLYQREWARQCIKDLRSRWTFDCCSLSYVIVPVYMFLVIVIQREDSIKDEYIGRRVILKLGYNSQALQCARSTMSPPFCSGSSML